MHHWRMGVEILSCTYQFVMSIFLIFNELVIFIVLIAFHFVSLGRITSRAPRRFNVFLARQHDNGVFRTGKPAAKPLSFKAIEMMKPGDKDKADIGENRGLRVTCGATGVKSFFYRTAAL